MSVPDEPEDSKGRKEGGAMDQVSKYPWGKYHF